MSGSPDFDTLVIGGGFYGCSLALFQRAAGHKVALVEARDVLLDRASRANQARIHTGFHYPRSALTAVKSMVLHQRFAQEFPGAVIDDFQMLYAVPRRNTKVSATRFHRLFSDLGAPIEVASQHQRALFAGELIEGVFACREWAFDYRVLRRQMTDSIDRSGVRLHLGTEAISLEEHPDRVVVHLSSGQSLSARHVFNVTYSQTNRLLAKGGFPSAPLKHELAEIALVEVPPVLEGVGVTVMDGLFFSCMPYPAESLHSLTHVRYTPAFSWTDEQTAHSAYTVAAGLPKNSRHRHMLLDAQRYLPALGKARWVKSMFETKTVLMKNERDDGRPILFQRQPADSRLISIMGGKIDNIYDLFEVLQASGLNEAPPA